MIVNYLLVILLGFMGNTATAAQKKYGRLVGNRQQSTLLYSVGTSIFSLFSFSVMAGGKLGGDMTAVAFGLIYGFICAASLVTNFLAYAKMNLITMAVFTKGSVITNWLIGILVFDEKVKLTSILSVSLIFITVIAPLFNKGKDGSRKVNLSSYFVGILMIFISGCATLLTQIYYTMPETDSQSVSVMCFYTNLFLTFIMIGMFLFASAKSRGGMGAIAEIRAVKPIYFLLIPLCSICQNPASVISAYVLKTMPLSIYTVFSTGTGSIILYLFSKFIFKEKPTKFELTMWIIATLAALLTIF